MFAIVCAVLWPHGVEAAEAVGIDVRCAELDANKQAAVEARSRAELIGRSVEAGRLLLHCDGPLLSASFTTPQGASTELSESGVVATDRADALVTLVGKLLETRYPAEEAVVPPPPPPPVSSGMADATGSGAPSAKPTAALEPQLPESDPELRPDTATDRPTSDEAPLPPSTLVIGGALDTWSAEIGGTRGLLLGAAVPLSQRFAVRGGGSYAWGLSTVKGVSVQHLLIEAALESSVTPWSLVSLGGGLSSMTFDASDKEADGATTSFAPVLTLAFRLVPRQTSPRFTLGPGARLYGKVRQATVDEKPVLTTPRWSLALEAEVRFDL